MMFHMAPYWHGKQVTNVGRGSRVKNERARGVSWEGGSNFWSVGNRQIRFRRWSCRVAEALPQMGGRHGLGRSAAAKWGRASAGKGQMKLEEQCRRVGGKNNRGREGTRGHTGLACRLYWMHLSFRDGHTDEQGERQRHEGGESAPNGGGG